MEGAGGPSPSSDFLAASSYLSKAPLKLPNATKLRLYALYKISTIGFAGPPNARPAIWELEGRAKWGSWKAHGAELLAAGGDEAIERTAEEEYLKLAKELGWRGHDVESSKAEAEGVEAEESGDSGLRGMVSVSKMAAPEGVPRPEPGGPSTLYDLAIDGDVDSLNTLSPAPSAPDVYARNEQGYTPLHLAADGGHLGFVEALIRLGADVHLKDDDGLTAEELAKEAGRTEVEVFLRSRREGRT